MIKDCTKSYNDSEESGVKLNYFDNKIDQFATYLQKRNNLRSYSIFASTFRDAGLSCKYR